MIEDVRKRQPSDALVDAEEEQALRDALSELSERDRILITCLYLTDRPMTYIETRSASASRSAASAP